MVKRTERRRVIAECETCGAAAPRAACSPYDVVRRQLETCRDSIEAALRQVAERGAVASESEVSVDMFSYGPQGAD
jgi:hypothetical protein